MSEELEPEFYECGKCGRLFAADSYADARCLVSSSGIEITCEGDDVRDFVENKAWVVLCLKCRGVKT